MLDSFCISKIIYASPEKDKRIIQNWRTSDFSDNDIDSTLEIIFEPVERGTKLTIKHSNLPEGQGKTYEDGWDEYYFKPMKKYFKNFKKVGHLLTVLFVKLFDGLIVKFNEVKTYTKYYCMYLRLDYDHSSNPI